MNQAVKSILERFGTACTVEEVSTSRDATTGAITATSTSYTGVAYRKASVKHATGLNPSVKAVLIVSMDEGYIIKPKDLITHAGYSTQQVLKAQVVEPLEGLAYQLVEV